jgi:hypothetical protein
MNTRGKIHSLIPLLWRGAEGGVVLLKRTGRFTVNLQSVLKNLSGSLLLSVFLIAVTPASVNSVHSLSVTNPYLTSSISGGLIRPLFLKGNASILACSHTIQKSNASILACSPSLLKFNSNPNICHSFMFLKGISTMIIPSFISNILFLICVFDILYLIFDIASFRNTVVNQTNILSTFNNKGLLPWLY